MQDNIITEPVVIEDDSVIEERQIVEVQQLNYTIPLHTHPGTIRLPVVILQLAHTILKTIKRHQSIFLKLGLPFYRHIHARWDAYTRSWPNYHVKRFPANWEILWYDMHYLAAYFLCARPRTNYRTEVSPYTTGLNWAEQTKTRYLEENTDRHIGFEVLTDNFWIRCPSHYNLDVYHGDYNIMVEYISQQNKFPIHIYKDGTWTTSVPQREWDNETEYSDNQDNDLDHALSVNGKKDPNMVVIDTGSWPNVFRDASFLPFPAKPIHGHKHVYGVGGTVPMQEGDQRATIHYVICPTQDYNLFNPHLAHKAGKHAAFDGFKLE